MVAWFYFIVFAVSLAMVGVFLRRNARIDTIYAVFCIMVVLNSMGRWLISVSDTIEQAVWANKLMYVGACYAPLLLVIALARLCDLAIPKAIIRLLTAYSTVVLAAVMSIGYSEFYYKSVSLAEGAGYKYLTKVYGPLHSLYPILMVLYMLFVLYLIIYSIKRRNEISSRTVAAIGGLCILILVTYMLSRILNTSIEWHSIGYLVAVIVVARRFEHFNMYDMTANVENSIERMKEYGFIVYDMKGNFVNANKLVKSIFPEITEWKTEKPVPPNDTAFYNEVIRWYEERDGQDSKTVKLNGYYFDLAVRDVIYGDKKVGEMLELIDRTAEHDYMDKVEEARREAIEANHAKSNFLAQMSHEIRTPINAVLGMNEMILRETGEKNIQEYAANAYNAGKALLSIINDVLDISKIEAGKLEIVETEYDLHSLISDCYHMTVDRAEKKGLEFLVVCDEKLPSKYVGDMFHIRQIVVNFITNAIKYTDSGSIELGISGIHAGDDFLLRLSVKDTGIGLKIESIKNLFTSFQRFDLERNQSIEGTGLGLAICKRLSELMGGSVQVESIYGEGSVFTCEIPQQVADVEPIGVLNIEKSADKINIEKREMFIAPQAHILVVDDVEMNIVVFKNFLKNHQMRIDTAQSGKRCLELASENTYDIIFMDHMMPEMDGIETFRQLKEQKLIKAGTPVIMLTANAISGEEEKYLLAGFSSYLTKPIQSDKLDKLLLKYLPADKIEMPEIGMPEKQNEAAYADIDVDESDGNDFFDVAAGMKYNGNDRQIYYKILDMYVRDGERKIKCICEYFRNMEWKDYVIEVHALKSSSLMIGSRQLSEAAKELELAGKNGEYDIINEKNEDMLKLYRSVLLRGREELEKQGLLSDVSSDEKGTDEGTEISPQELDRYIKEICAACDNFDGDLIVKLCDEAGKYMYKGVALKEMLNPVKRAASDFEYEAAKEKAAAVAVRSLKVEPSI